MDNNNIIFTILLLARQSVVSRYQTSVQKNDVHCFFYRCYYIYQKYNWLYFTLRLDYALTHTHKKENEEKKDLCCLLIRLRINLIRF